MSIKIVIVDDHEIVREGLRTLITRARPHWEIIGEGSSGAQAIEMCETLKPDVIVLDITMPGMSGLEAASKMAASRSTCRVLMFTMHESERLPGEVRQAGAHGFVLKSQAARDLIRAIDCLLAGGTFFGSEPTTEKGRLGHASFGFYESSICSELRGTDCRYQSSEPSPRRKDIRSFRSSEVLRL